MIDWRVARGVGSRVVGEPPQALLPGDLDALAADAAERVIAYTGMEPQVALPPAEAVDRPVWLDANLRSMRLLLDPAADRLTGGLDALGPLAAPVRSAAGAALGAEVGGLAGYLGRRVLGQYDLALLDGEVPPRLLLVAPNLTEAAERLDVPLDQLLAWVTVHEVTHAVQFSSVGWLRDHVGGLVSELLGSIEAPAGLGLKLPTQDELKAFVGAVQTGELIGLLGGPERQALLDRIQATMALVEGHAEHVMDAVGADVLDDLPALRAALDRRREEREGVGRWFERLIGLEAKLRQYTQGKAFCDLVVAEAGVPALHRAWEGPNLLPSLAELDEPERWLARTHLA